jgi:hypothetical protein
MYEIVKLLSAIFLRAFVVAFVLLLISSLGWLGAREIWMETTMRWFGLSNPETLNLMMLNWIAQMKLIIFLLFLVPGLALYWTTKSLEKVFGKSV